jgi:hypothetical protein
LNSTGIIAAAAALALSLTGCFQELDSRAAKGSAPVAPDKAGPTIVLDTPPIDLPDGTTTTDRCKLITLQAREILHTNCARCHGGESPGARQGQPPFDCVMDFDKLQTMVSASVRDPRDPGRGMRFLIPGDPDNSRLYVRIARAEMPPVPPLGLDAIPMPSVSDVSLLRTWIGSWLGGEGGMAIASVPPKPPADGAAAADAGVAALDAAPGGGAGDMRPDAPVSRLNAGRIPLHDAAADAPPPAQR